MAGGRSSAVVPYISLRYSITYSDLHTLMQRRIAQYVRTTHSITLCLHLHFSCEKHILTPKRLHRTKRNYSETI
jgi:hypothetical protein